MSGSESFAFPMPTQNRYGGLIRYLGKFEQVFMITREDMKPWVVTALKSMGGVGWPRDVAKYIWDHYESDIKRSGSLLYTWQYDVRWTAMAMRKDGVLKPVDGRNDKPWELA